MVACEVATACVAARGMRPRVVGLARLGTGAPAALV